MPFNIELNKISKDVSIKVQVLKNTITVYFNGPKSAAETMVDHWEHLEKHFLATLPGFIPTRVQNPRALHVKISHLYEGELEIVHTHSEFDFEITPQLFESYLNQFYLQQKRHHKSKYQFFINDTEVIEMAAAYAGYYQQYKGSSVEMLYEEETALSIAEKFENQLIKNVNSLLNLITRGRHPFYHSAISATQATLTEEQSVPIRTI